MSEAIIKLERISKSIGAQQILSNVSFELPSGMVLALVGENGAGKSTIVNLLSGCDDEYAGVICVNGKPVRFKSPSQALRHGIAVVEQDVHLFDNFSVAENIFCVETALGMGKRFWLSHTEQVQRARALLSSLCSDICPQTPVAQLNLAQKRMVQIAKAISQRPSLLVLDEPTASMTVAEQENFFQVIKEIKRLGTSILFISQKINDVLQIADEILIIKDGTLTGQLNSDTINYLQLLHLMSGKHYINRYPKFSIQKGKELLAVEDLSVENLLHDINFSLQEGEIIGIAGLTGSGKTTLARSLFGMQKISSGQIFVDRLPASITSPQRAIEMGIAYITEDRMEDGLFDNLSLLNNAYLFRNQKHFWIDDAARNKQFCSHAREFHLFPGQGCLTPKVLSGGNQQKLLLLRWFLSDCRVLILDDPMRNVDIPSKTDLYNIIGDALRKKAGIILISSDIEELIGMCDRIMILKDGTFISDQDTSHTDYEEVFRAL